MYVVLWLLVLGFWSRFSRTNLNSNQSGSYRHHKLLATFGLRGQQSFVKRSNGRHQGRKFMSCSHRQEGGTAS